MDAGFARCTSGLKRKKLANFFFFAFFSVSWTVTALCEAKAINEGIDCAREKEKAICCLGNESLQCVCVLVHEWVCVCVCVCMCTRGRRERRKIPSLSQRGSPIQAKHVLWADNKDTHHLSLRFLYYREFIDTRICKGVCERVTVRERERERKKDEKEYWTSEKRDIALIVFREKVKKLGVFTHEVQV